MGGFAYFPPSNLANCLGGYSSLGAGGGGSLSFDFTTGSLPGGITFTRASTGTYNSSGNILTVASINAARFNYVTGVACLLIEPTATNLALQSNSFGAGNWFPLNGAVPTAAQFVSPDGTNNGWSLTSGTGFGAVQSTTLTPANIPHTLSVWVKRIVGTAPLVLQIGATNGGNLTTSTTLARLASTITPAAAPTNFSIYTSAAAGNTNGIYGAQAETGLVATSYIPTTNGTATRAADSATFTIPAGIGHLTYTFDDNSTQLVTVSAGSYTIPTNLNRPNIKSIVGSA